MVPGKSSPVNDTGNGVIRVINMPVVTPVCVQNTNRLIFLGIGTHSGNIQVGVLYQVHPLIPAAHTGTKILLHACLGHFPGFILPLVGRITPVQADNLFRELFYKFRLSHDHVSPEHRLFALFHQEIAQILYIIYINPVHALFIRQGF
ncbi:hypothetical protein IMSAGC019_04024 [Lachnospiraceae bacterium]|nr:hypothetical protein IMSAGC019_04024 [Lachnospiraceae bacterium]